MSTIHRKDVLRLAEQVERDLIEARSNLFGTTTCGNEYPSVKDMWISQLCSVQEYHRNVYDQDQSSNAPKQLNSTSWYEKSFDYWERSDLTLDSVLGGYAALSPSDLAGSTNFLLNLKRLRPCMGFQYAADCGAGIGRITRDFLLNHFECVDLIEQSPGLVSAASKFLGDARSNVEFICVGLQDFSPENEKYDLIWVQWVVGYLTDVDFVKFLKRCKRALKPSGLIIIKDNCCTYESESYLDSERGDSAFVLDSEDSSLTRSLPYFRSLFKEADVELVSQQIETSSFPDEIFPVYFFALC